jgi:hypothetical protein
MLMQVGDDNECTAVCCSLDGTIFVGDASGTVWVVGGASEGMSSHGQAVACPPASVQAIIAEGRHMIVANEAGMVFGFRHQDACWVQVVEVCISLRNESAECFMND